MAVPRKLRIQSPGAIYHVMNRGDQREAIFRDDEDRQKLLTTLGEACRKTERVAPNHYGGERHETGVQKAERIVREELNRLGWPEAELRARRKGHSGKVRIARRLRQETTMSLKWIAARLQMGGWTYVSNLAHQQPPCPAAQDVLCQ